MSAHGRLFVLASGVQGGGAHPPAAHDMPVVLSVMALICVPIVMAVHRRSQRPKPVSNQWQALAVMGELCPPGWQAHMTVYGWGAPVPDDAPPARAPLVELEWKQFSEEPGRVAIARRVWAPTIEHALQVKVDDRRTDLALEQIEQAAAQDDELRWPDWRVDPD